MAGFVVYFILCNLLISGMICILFTAKRAFRTMLSSRMQYRLGFLLFLFLALPFIPARLPMPSWYHSQTITHSDYGNPATKEGISTNPSGTPRQIGDFAISVSRKAPSSAKYVLCLLWFAGIFVMMVLTAHSFLHLRKVTGSSLPLQNSKVRNLYYECLNEMKIGLKIPIYSTAFLKSPAIVGLLRPRIYLPIHTISDDSDTSMRFMLLHELQHFKHKDMAVNYFIIMAGILYWFNPFVWYAFQRIRCDREIACDCAVLQMLQESEYENYGNALINFAEKISKENISFPFITGIGGNRKQIRKRILNISNFKKENRRRKMQSHFACIFIMAVFLAIFPLFPTYATGQERYHFEEKDKDITYLDLSSEFEGFKGSFVLYDSCEDHWMIYNKEAASEQTSPGSTYKIYDALLGLESGIITPEHSKMTWNGEDYPFDAWESDQDLHSAMQSSVNWYFQNIDHMAGMNNVRSFLQKIAYGNQHAGDSADLYWTDFSLKISPIEQVDMLKKLYQNEFGFSGKNINAVKDAIRFDARPNASLSGKTGTCRVNGQDTNGWFMGYIEKSGHVAYFATNIQGISNATGSAASEITLSILSDMGLWETQAES